MTTSRALVGLSALLLSAFPLCATLSGQTTAPVAVETKESILARIVPPSFPERDFPITDFGGSPDADNTEALRKAIAACHEAGGGRVIVPAGVFRTGPVHLLSNVNLHLADGATLKFDPDPAKYLPLVLTRFEGTECMNYSPLIYALDQENIAVTGKGTLDGSGTLDTWLGWAKRRPNTTQPAMQVSARNRLVQMGEANVPVDQRTFGPAGNLRPNFIQPYRCKNVLLEDFTLINSPMWCTNPVLCTNVTVRGINVESRGANNDGCDPECSRDVLIDGCSFTTGDDCIAIKSGRNTDGRRINVPSENIIVRNCTMKDGHGGVTVGSEISGSCRNVFVDNCKMDSPNLNQAIRFKSNAQRGGTIEHVSVNNVTIGKVGNAVLSVEFLYEEGAKGPYQPVLRDVTLKNVSTESCTRVVNIASFPKATIEDIRLIDCTFHGVAEPNRIIDAPTPEMQNVQVFGPGH